MVHNTAVDTDELLVALQCTPALPASNDYACAYNAYLLTLSSAAAAAAAAAVPVQARKP
jgi:hypothetical protein